MLNMYRFERRIQGYVEARAIVGLALALVRGTDVIYARGFGTTSVEDGGIGVTPNTLFCIGSISKSLTSTLVMRLVEQGKLDLDTAVVDYLPGFGFSDATLGGRVTLRQVLSHTTGLPPAGKDFGPRDPDALKRFVWEEIPRYGFVAEPGAVQLYSNTVFVLAGYLAEVVTGKYYEQLVRELVFDPLRMERATFDRTVAMTYPLALAHEQTDDRGLRTRHRFTDNVSGNPAGFGIASTLDLANFAIMHLSQGRFDDRAILSPESIAQMHAPQANLYSPGSDAAYGLGFFVGDYKGVRQVSHGGMLESYWCNLSLFPDAGVAVILQCNCGDESKLMSLAGDLYDHLLAPPGTRAQPTSVATDRSRWPLHVGTYLSVQSGLAAVEVVGDQLVLERYGTVEPLAAAPGGGYSAGGTPVAFLPRGPEPSEYLIVRGEPYRRATLDPSFTPDPTVWERYAGLYEEFPGDPYSIRIRVDGGQLLMHRWGDEVACTPISDACFIGKRGLIEFESPGDGGAPVLIVGQGSRLKRAPAPA